MFISAALFERYESRIQLAVINNSGWKMFMNIIHVQMYEFFLISLKVKRFLYLIKQSFWSQPRSQIINLKASISKFEKKSFFFLGLKEKRKFLRTSFIVTILVPPKGINLLPGVNNFTQICVTVSWSPYSSFCIIFPPGLAYRSRYIFFFKFDLFMQFLGTPLIPWGN